MMTPQQLLQQYEEGRTTATGLMLDVLNTTDQRVVAETLELLPPEVLRQLKEFVGYYGPRTRIFRGPRPKMETVRFVKDWFARPIRSAQ